MFCEPRHACVGDAGVRCSCSGSSPELLEPPQQPRLRGLWPVCSMDRQEMAPSAEGFEGAPPGKIPAPGVAAEGTECCQSLALLC